MSEDHLLFGNPISPLVFHFIFEELGLDFNLPSFSVWGDLEVTFTVTQTSSSYAVWHLSLKVRRFAEFRNAGWI